MPVHTQLSLDGTHPFGVEPIIPPATFITPWRYLGIVRLMAGQNAPTATGCEQGFAVLRGSVICRDDTIVRAPAVVLANGFSYPLRAATTCVLLSIQVAESNPSEILLVEALAADKMTRKPSIHGGGGQLATRHVWGPEQFSSSWTFLDHAILSQDSAVGYHYHEGLEECFVIRSGKGYMTVDDETFEVGPGSVTFQGIGQGHGIFNPHSEPLDFLRIAVAVPGDQVTTVNLEDDLTARTPVPTS